MPGAEVACRASERSHPARKTAVETIAIPAARFSHVYVDIVGPWPPSRAGNRYLLTMIDRSTRWFEAVPLGGITADLVLDAFVATWVARFGLLSQVTTDRGTQFTSGTWGVWCAAQGVRHITTTAFHPQSNGMVERLHRQIKDALRARGAAAAWQDHLPWVMLGLRTVPKDDSNISAAEATLGQQLVVPGQLMPTQNGPVVAQAEREVIPPSRRSYAEVVATGRSPLDLATWVYVRRGGAGLPLADAYAGPYRVLESGEKTFRLQIGDREEVLSRDRLKPHRGDDNPQEAVPPRRGHPLDLNSMYCTVVTC